MTKALPAKGILNLCMLVCKCKLDAHLLLLGKVYRHQKLIEDLEDSSHWRLSSQPFFALLPLEEAP